MSKLTILEVDAITGESVVRDMTPEEIAQREIDQENEQQRLNDLQNKENAKNALYQKLGITAEEAKLLLS
jgi:hypothetical protein